MKASLLLSVLFFVALLGGAGLFAYQKSIPDTKVLDEHMLTQLNRVASLDTNTNELALRNRIHLESNYDAITQSMGALEKAVAAIGEDELNAPALKDTLFAKRYAALQQEIEVKAELIENFKTRFAVLRNSERYAPIVGGRLIEVAEAHKAPDVANIYRDVIIQVLSHTSQDTNDKSMDVSLLTRKLQATEALMPETALTDIIEFTRHASTVFVEIEFVDTYLTKALQATTDLYIAELKQAWSSWAAQYDKPRSILEVAFIAYVAYILLVLAITLFLLRSMYKNMGSKIEQKTDELQTTFEQLAESEKQLMQAEKMSSLGQLVAGIAHEVNTPLGYVSSNLSTIKRDYQSLCLLYTAVEKLSIEAAAGAKDKVKFRRVLQEIVRIFRNLNKESTVAEMAELLEDSNHGLDQISQLVISLKDFSRIDKSDNSSVDVHESLKSTLKMCTSVLRGRQIVQLYNGTIPEARFSAAQLNQVFLNILTNAAHATSAENGVINIITNYSTEGIVIEFKDNGNGMDKQTQERIFDPFFTTKGVSEGSGLGMSITYKLIKNHGGDINVKSNLGEGTTVTVMLPAAEEQS